MLAHGPRIPEPQHPSSPSASPESAPEPRFPDTPPPEGERAPSVAVDLPLIPPVVLSEKPPEVAPDKRLLKKLRVVGTIEATSWGATWFFLGIASHASSTGGPQAAAFWVLLALASWVTAVSFGRAKMNVARGLARAADGARESLRAREALSASGEALRVLGAWAEGATSWVVGVTTPPSVDPESRLPDNKVPNGMTLTLKPPAVVLREASGIPEPPPSPPPSHPTLSREPDHDPATCVVCNPKSEPPLFPSEPEPPYGPSYVPATPSPESEE